MQGTKSHDITKPFVITPEGLSRLVTALPVGAKPIVYSVDCIDGTTFYPESIDELLNLPNPEMRAIIVIKIDSGYRGENLRFAISLSNKEFGGASYSVNGEATGVISLADTIDQHLEAMIAGKPHFVNTFSFFFDNLFSLIVVLLSSFIIWGTLLGSWVVFIRGQNITLLSHRLSGAVLIELLIFCIPIWLIGVRSHRLKEYFFPRVAFCIGNGTIRYNQMMSRRNLFGLSALVAIILGLFVNLISALLVVH